MKLISILKGVTVKAAKPNKPFGYLPDMLGAVTEHFAFVERPTDMSKLIPHGNVQPELPAIFRHGKVEIEGRSLIIEELQIFQSGILVTTPNNTNDSDLIADYVFLWAFERFQLEFQQIRSPLHSSQLEIQFDRSLPDLFLPLKEIGAAINRGLDSYWEFIPPYELTSLQFGIDVTRTPAANSGLFKIERRADIPFEMDIYYCEAAMTTDNHLTVLSRFERICLERFAER
jgi:hypothetical protein